jgi:hypothetical protein
MSNPSQRNIHAPSDCPAWCITDRAGAVFDPIHWTEPEQFDSIGEHGPAVNAQVRIQGSLHHGEVPPARVHVDTRFGDRDVWHAMLVLTPVQARTLSACVVLVAEIIGAP